jgi:hypothetical protein
MALNQGSGGVVLDGLISWFRPDQTTVNFVDDKAAYTATNNKAIWNEGWMQGNASDAWVQMNAVPSPTTEATIAVYVNPNMSVAWQNATDQQNTLFGNANVKIDLRSTASTAVYVHGFSVSYGGALYQGNSVNLTRYTDPALFTLTMNAELAILYKNDVELCRKTYTSTNGLISWSAVAPLWFTTDKSIRYSDMGIRDTLIYNRALSPSEVKRNYAAIV